MKKEELENLLEYINNVIKSLSKNDSDRSFYYYQRDEIKKKLEMINNEGQNQRD